MTIFCRANAALQAHKSKLDSHKALRSPASYASTASRQQDNVQQSEGELTPRRGFAAAMAGIAAAVGLQASSQPPADIYGAEDIAAASPKRGLGALVQERQGGTATAGTRDDRVAKDISPVGSQSDHPAEQTVAAENSKPATPPLSTGLSRTPAQSPDASIAACRGSQGLRSLFHSPNSQDARSGEKVRKPKSPLSGDLMGIGSPIGSSTPSKTLRFGKPLMMMGDLRNKENSPAWKP